MKKLLTCPPLFAIVPLHTVTQTTKNNMRTKTLICAAVLMAAGVATSLAQSNVYSLNVVGYVNVPTTGAGNFNMMANPLNNANNGITNLFATAQDGDQI